MPLLNTAILLTSGLAITIAHHALRAGHGAQLSLFLALTFLLASSSSACRPPRSMSLKELGLQLGTGVSGFTFFMLTGFHGLHVTVARSCCW